MLAQIYKPTKTAMQSGKGADQWVLRFARSERRFTDPLMGWTSSGETRSQIRMRFDTKEQAIAFAKRHGLPYRVLESHPRKRVKKSYADNFKFGRRVSWTH